MADEFSIDFDQGDIEKALNKLIVATPKQVLEAFESVGRELIIPAIRARLRIHKINNSGQLSKGLKIRVVFDKKKPRLIIVGERDYTLNVEQGSPPHEANFAKLLKWVRKRKREAPAEEVAGKIFKKIKEEGTSARPFMLPGFRDALPDVLTHFQKKFKFK